MVSHSISLCLFTWAMYRPPTCKKSRLFDRETKTRHLDLDIEWDHLISTGYTINHQPKVQYGYLSIYLSIYLSLYIYIYRSSELYPRHTPLLYPHDIHHDLTIQLGLWAPWALRSPTDTPLFGNGWWTGVPTWLRKAAHYVTLHPSNFMIDSLVYLLNDVRLEFISLVEVST